MSHRIENLLPRNLFHYCPLESFYGIITNKNIRLCSSKYTNDPNENKIIDRIIDDFMKSRGNKKQKVFLESAIKKFNERASNKQFNAPFVFCLSEKHEDLNQWRNYADNGRGIAIGFNTENFPFKRVFPTLLISPREIILFNLPTFEEIYIDKCIYNSKYQYQLIKSLIKFYSGIPEITDEQIQQFNLYLKFFSAFFKDYAFRDEQEWRIVCFPFTLQVLGTLKIPLKYFAKRSVIVPFIEIPLISEPDKFPFDYSFIGRNAKNDDDDLADFIVNSHINFLQGFIRSRIEIQEFQ
jgi:Protein of unknown function (DUF2971)